MLCQNSLTSVLSVQSQKKRERNFPCAEVRLEPGDQSLSPGTTLRMTATVIAHTGVGHHSVYNGRKAAGTPSTKRVIRGRENLK